MKDEEAILKMLEASVYKKLKPIGTNLTPKKKKRKK